MSSDGGHGGVRAREESTRYTYDKIISNVDGPKAEDYSRQLRRHRPLYDRPRYFSTLSPILFLFFFADVLWNGEGP